MARIRSVKPDFWEDEKVGEMSLAARLLFIGTWNLADDEGLLRWTPDYINASLFMYDDFTVRKVRALMDELEAAGGIHPYKGPTQQRLGWIVNFHRHQRINRPQPGKFPAPSLQNAEVRLAYGIRDKWVCHLCGSQIVQPGPGTDRNLELSLDHLVPRSHGGSDYPSNIKVAHGGCNSGRGNRALLDDVIDSVNEDVNGSLPARKEQGAGSEEQGKGTGIKGAVAASGSAQALVAKWIDHEPQRPPDRVVGQVAKEVAGLIAEGYGLKDVEYALAEWARRRLHPSTLPSIFHELQAPKQSSQRESGVARVLRMAEQLGRDVPEVTA